jgi:antitoxin component YwqK of YwqJK toxin-antitoxin module
MKVQATFTFFLLSGLSAGCLAGSAAESEDLLLANEVPTHVSKSSTGDFFVDAKTDLGWSTRVSVALDYSEAPMYCASLGFGWRLPTLGEVQTMTEGAGKQKRLRADFKTGLPSEGLLFSAEEIPVIDDDKQPLAMRIANGETVNAHGREGYVRCAHGPESRKRKPFPVPAAELLGERWWEMDNACPAGSVARGTLGLEIACKSKLAERNGRSTRWTKGERLDASYRNDKLHGSVTRWRAGSGTASVLNYRNGEFHGRNTQWYPNGQKSSESEFTSGVLNGLQQGWDEKGQLQMRTRYRKGRIVEQLYYDHDKPRDGVIEQAYANGVTSYVGTFKKGRAVGQHYGYHENGKLRFKRLYNAKGIPDGASADWHANGHAHEVSTFKNGALQGERAVYSEDGKVLSRVRYDQGLVVTK